MDSDPLHTVHLSISVLRMSIGRGKGTTRLKKNSAIAVTATELENKAVKAALTENSIREFVKPPSDEEDSDTISWNSLAVDVLFAMAEVFEEAPKKKKAIKKEYMACLRALVKGARDSKLPGVLRSIVPGLLTYLYQWLQNIVLRATMAIDIWKVLRDVLEVDENRAMLSHGLLKNWAQVCMDQIVGCGEFYFDSPIVTNLARDTFVILSNPTPSFDVLTQRTRSASGSMQGFEYCYVILTELASQMLVLARPMLRCVNQFDLQCTALKVITSVLERYCIDFTGSRASKTILKLAIPASESLWVEKRYHKDAVDAAKFLVRLAMCNSQIEDIEPIRERIKDDFGGNQGMEDVASAPRKVKDILVAEVELAAFVFEAREIVDKVAASEPSVVNLVAWLRVLECSLRCGVPKLKRPSDVLLLCAHSIDTVGRLISKDVNSPKRVSAPVLIDSCQAILSAAELTNRVFQTVGESTLERGSDYATVRNSWTKTYSVLMHHLIQVNYSGSHRVQRMGEFAARVSRSKKALMECIVAILDYGLVDKSTLKSSHSERSGSSKGSSVSWQSIISEGSEWLSDEAISFARSHMSLAGIRDFGGNLSFPLNLIRLALRFCDPHFSGQGSAVSGCGLRNAISVCLGLSRGVCSKPLLEDIKLSETDFYDTTARNIDAFISNFCSANVHSGSTGPHYVQQARTVLRISGVDSCVDLFGGERVDEGRDGLFEPIHFSVDPAVTSILEREILERVLFLLPIETDEEGESDLSWLGDVSSDDLGFACMFKARFTPFSDSEITKPLRENQDAAIFVACFIAIYLDHGIRFGTIGAHELDGNETVARLFVVLFLLVEKLVSTESESLLSYPEVTAGFIISAAKLCEHWRNYRSETGSEGSVLPSSEMNSLASRPMTRFSDMVSNIVSDFCTKLCLVVHSETEAVLNRIKFYSGEKSARGGSKRPRTDSMNSASRRKKQRKVHGSSTGKTNQLAFSDYESDEDHVEDAGTMSNESDDDFGEKELRSKRPASGATNGTEYQIASPDYQVDARKLASVLLRCIRARSQLKDIVLEKCGATLRQLASLESKVLGKSGDLSDLVASGVVSDSYMTTRSCLWELCLLNVSNDLDQATTGDLVRFASKWLIAEEHAIKIAKYYGQEISCRIRKRYPHLECHEKLRRLLFTLVTRALRSRRFGLSKESASSSSPNNRILSDLCSLHERYRKLDGFSMPKSIRVAFAYFSVEIVGYAVRHSSKLSQRNDVGDGTTPQSIDASVRDSLFNQMSDSDASVRIAVTGAIREFLNLSHVDYERVPLDGLSSPETCTDGPELVQDDGKTEKRSQSVQRKSWNLQDTVLEEFVSIRERFETVGRSGRGVTVFITLCEIGMKSWIQLPDCIFEMLRRVAEVGSSDEIGFNAIIRLCAFLDVDGPEELFAVAQRLVFPLWFSLYSDFDKLQLFPVKLVLNQGRNDIDSRVHWMSNYAAELIPFLAVADRDNPSLDNLKKFSEYLDSNLTELLVDYFGAVSRIYPMQFISGLDGDGVKLWRAVDSKIQKGAASMIDSNRGAVFVSLLMSVSSDCSMCIGHSSQHAQKVFYRNCSATEPPFYDPKFVWTALNSLCLSESKPIQLMSRRAMIGQLFDSRTMQSGGNEGEEIAAIAKKISGYTGLVLPILFETSKLLSGPPCPVLPQNRTDAFLILGTVWKIASSKIIREINCRKLFSNLVMQGFMFQETAFNALWLFNTFVDDLVSNRCEMKMNELYMDDDLHEMLVNTGISHATEVCFFEVLSSCMPTLIDISFGSRGDIPKKAAVEAIRRVSIVSKRRFPNAFSAIDLIPNSVELQDVRKAQEDAWDSSMSKSTDPIEDELKSFVFSERRSAYESRRIVMTVSKLRRLRKALVEENVAKIASVIRDETWLRGEGRPEMMLNLLNTVLAQLVDLSFEMSELLSSTGRVGSGSRCDLGQANNISEQFSPQVVLQDCTWLIGMLGTIHPTSLVLESTRKRRTQRLRAIHESACPELHSNGIFKSFVALRVLLFADSPVVAYVAYLSIVAVLGSDDGKNFFANNREKLVPLNEFRVIARKRGIASLSNKSESYFNSLTGCLVLPTFLDLIDKDLWKVPKEVRGEDSLLDFWVKRLASTVARSCESEAYQELSALCFVCAEFSRLMLPYFLMDLAKYLEDDDMDAISKHISELLLKDPSVPVEIVRIIVHSLDVSCQLQLDVLRKKGRAHAFGKDVEEELPYIYLFDIGYLTVAEAAARVGMFFSALRYVSLFVDYACVAEERKDIQRQNTSGRKSSSKRPSHVSQGRSVREQALRRSEHILIAVAENINEPDMSRGLGRDRELLEAATSVAVMDSNWARSIGSLDFLCHEKQGTTSTAANECESNDNSNLNPEPVDNVEALPRRELMLISSLNGLGCTNLTSQYWNELKEKMTQHQLSLNCEPGRLNRYFDAIDELNERRFAAAWKLGDWEVPDLIPSDKRWRAKRSAGLHHTLHGTLVALRARDICSIESSLHAGRNSQAAWLGQTDSSESAYRMYQMAGRVRVLNKLESVVLAVTENFQRSHMQGVQESIVASHATQRPVDDDDDVSDSQLEHILATLDVSTVSRTAEGLGIPLDSENSSSRDLSLALQNSVARCIGSPSIIARFSANLARDIIESGGSGSWSRAATALGTRSSVLLEECDPIDSISWQLMEATLRWTSCQDGGTRQKALADVKNLIEKDLGGCCKTSPPKGKEEEESYSHIWSEQDGGHRVALIRAKACQLVSSWSSEIRAEEPATLFKTYLELGLTAFFDHDSDSGRDTMHCFMAEFADSQLASIDGYRKTREYDQKVSAIKKTERKIRKFESVEGEKLVNGADSSNTGRRRSQSKTAKGDNKKMQKDLKVLVKELKTRLKQDKGPLEALRKNYDFWQLMACRHYAAALRDKSSNDLRCSFRLVALWLDSGSMRNAITRDLIGSEPLNRKNLDVPLSKLLPLFPQLCSRLDDSTKDSFQESLSATIVMMGDHFPTHCLWQLLAMSKLTRHGTDEKLASFYRGDPGKKDAADRILTSLESKNSATLKEMRLVANAYIHLSDTPKEQKANMKTINISRSKLCGLNNLQHVPVPTIGLPLYGFSDAKYKPPYIVDFGKTAGVCGGLSKPLTVECRGSDGHVYSQLVKGRDDLRGDAVMEQMFVIFNELLRRDSNATRRNLIVRTYRIVPMSPFSGIMQFVSNTDSLGGILVEGKKKKHSLHSRYRPHDMAHGEMADGAHKLNRTVTKKVDWLSKNWHRFQPVFRYFFLERWPDPVDWYSHQLAYTRSVAVMSIVGFILGIGDRHLSNVLMDTFSGEIVHIDFGIAFEKGKLLPTPEQMPFRLTRDIVDGFGVNGVDGTFRRCCEVTLDILRRNKDVLLTVIEVLLHDPMYNWALCPEKVLKEQLKGDGTRPDLDEVNNFESEENEMKVEGSEEAQRALRRIAEKLEGLEDTKRLSVEAHVARLIDEARNFQVIASVYPGWSPWV